MPNETGIWNAEEAAEYYAFDYKLAKWIGQYLPKDQVLLDVGCGRASYLRYLHDVGFTNLAGIEGSDQVFEFGGGADPALYSQIGAVSIQDLTAVPRKRHVIGNVLCLEVGEHIPPEYANTFIDNLARFTEGNLILSWAVPGQTGVGHVNCQFNIWVVDQFQSRGFKFLVGDSLEARQNVSNHAAYFRDTLMIFGR